MNDDFDTGGRIFRVLVCGGRHFTGRALLYMNLDDLLSHHKDTAVEIISGHASGADSLAEQYAVERGIMLRTFPADWNKYGKAAGPIRNADMLSYIMSKDSFPTVIAFWNGYSRGTKDMITKARNAGVPVKVVMYKD